MKFKVGDILCYKNEAKPFYIITGLDDRNYDLMKLKDNMFFGSICRSAVEQQLEICPPKEILESPLYKLLQEEE